MPELAPGNLPGITFGKTLKTRPARPRNIRIFKQARGPHARHYTGQHKRKYNSNYRRIYKCIDIGQYNVIVICKDASIAVCIGVSLCQM